MQVILIRHGESVANAKNSKAYEFLTGQWDCDLTEKGREQAQKLQGSPLFTDVDAWFVSDLRRARQTASYFADSEKTTVDARLRERSLGEFDGCAVADIQKIERYKPYFTDPALLNFRRDFVAKAPNGENYTDVCRRVGAFWQEVQAKGYHKIVIVAHFCTIQCLMKEILHLSEEETVLQKVYACTPICIEG